MTMLFVLVGVLLLICAGAIALEEIEEAIVREHINNKMREEMEEDDYDAAG